MKNTEKVCFQGMEPHFIRISINQKTNISNPELLKGLEPVK